MTVKNDYAFLKDPRFEDFGRLSKLLILAAAEELCAWSFDKDRSRTLLLHSFIKVGARNGAELLDEVFDHCPWGAPDIALKPSLRSTEWKSSCNCLPIVEAAILDDFKDDKYILEGWRQIRNHQSLVRHLPGNPKRVLTGHMNFAREVLQLSLCPIEQQLLLYAAQQLRKGKA